MLIKAEKIKVLNACLQLFLAKSSSTASRRHKQQTERDNTHQKKLLPTKNTNKTHSYLRKNTSTKKNLINNKTGATNLASLHSNSTSLRAQTSKRADARLQRSRTTTEGSFTRGERERSRSTRLSNPATLVAPTKPTSSIYLHPAQSRTQEKATSRCQKKSEKSLLFCFSAAGRSCSSS